MNLSYAVMNINDLDKVEFNTQNNSIMEMGESKLRRNVNNTEFIVTFGGPCPAFAQSKPLYNLHNIKLLLATKEWRQDNI